MKKKQSITSVLCILLLSLFVSCGSTNSPILSGSHGLLETIRSRGYIMVGATGDYPPLSYLNPETGRYEGLDADLSETIAKELGVKVRYTATTWPTINTDVLDAARFDIANCGITITEKRLETLDMSDGYLENGKTIICRKEDSSRFTSLEALNQEGVRVMVNPGGLNEKFARENLPKATLFIHEHNEKIPGKIAAGEADLMICETTEAPLYVKSYPVLDAPLIDKPFTHGQIGVLMRKGNPDLKLFIINVIKRMKEDGRLQQLKKKYL